MTVTTKTKREKLAEREDAIVTAASEIFLKKGMRAAKMAEIASAAGLAEGTLYLYFKNKEALFAAVVARHWQDLTKGASSVVSSSDAPWEQLEALARYTLKRILEDWQLFELSFVLHYGTSGHGDASDKRSYVKVFDGVVQRGIDRGEFSTAVAARHIRDLFFGTMEYAVRSALGRQAAADEEAIIAMLLGGLAGVLRPDATPAPATDLDLRIEKAVERLEGLVNQSFKT